MRLKVAQWGAELDAYGPQHWAMDFAAQPVSPIDHLGAATGGDAGVSPFHDSAQAPIPDHNDGHDRDFSPPLTLKEQTHIAQHLALLDKQNLEIVALYQRHFNEIQRLVNSQVVNCASPEEREYQKQELQREQEGARLQLQQLHELQQRQLLAQPADGRERYLVRSPSVDAHESMLSMMTQQSLSTQLVATAGVAAPSEASSASPSDLMLSPLTISHNEGFEDATHAGSGNPDVANSNHVENWTKTPGDADGTDDGLLATMTFLPYTPPTTSEVSDLGLSPVAEDHGTPSSAVLYSSKVSMLSPGDYTGGSESGNEDGSSGYNPSAPQEPHLLSGPVMSDLTTGTDNPENESSSSSEGARRTTVNEALRLYYTSRVTELRLEYQADLVALYRELRRMLKSSGENTQAQKIEALMVDIKKILVVLTRSAREEPIVDEHVEELDHVEAYIQRRVHPMSQRLKVKQAIFGDQRCVPATAARTAQRQWQRFLRRMRDQQQQSPSAALPVNVSPPRRLGM